MSVPLLISHLLGLCKSRVLFFPFGFHHSDGECSGERQNYGLSLKSSYFGKYLIKRFQLMNFQNSLIDELMTTNLKNTSKHSSSQWPKVKRLSNRYGTF
jgi:hypothetical protein